MLNPDFRSSPLADKSSRPILTPKTVLPLFFTIGIIFAPIGGLLLYASSQVQELQIDYTNCRSQAPKVDKVGDRGDPMDPSLITTAFKGANAPANAEWSRVEDVLVDYGRGIPIEVTQCVVQFTLPEDFTPPVLFYYRMSNFYQNHRRYVQSFSDIQLRGEALDVDAIENTKCEPLKKGRDEGDTEDRPYYPCGLIANSLFNDTFSSPSFLNGDEGEKYPMVSNSNIAWESDQELYKPSGYKKNESSVLPPPNWRKLWPTGYNETYPAPDLEHWEGFMVWMRTAGLPTFSKLFQRNDEDVMKAGTYRITINDGMFPCLSKLPWGSF